MKITLVVAMSENRVIGRDGGLPWHLSADLRRFKALTMGKPIVMGRKTFASIGRPLPGRRNIVVTRDKTFAAAGCEVVHSLAEAWAACRGQQEVMVIGGADIYGQALPGATRIYLTEVGGTFEGDTFFPPLNAGAWVEKERESHPPDAKNPHPYAFVTLERV